MNITGGGTPSKLSRPNTSGEVSFQTIGFITPESTMSRAARPAGLRAQSVGNDHGSAGGGGGAGGRGGAGGGAHPPPPSLRDLSELVGQGALRGVGHQRTSAMASGGTWRYVIDGERPTVSPAISRASRNEVAARYPRRSQAFGLPPTMMTSPR